MILYLDSSALVKLYVAEPESEQVRKLIARAKSVCTHLIGYAEICAAFGRAHRLGRVAAGALPTVLRDFERDWQTMEIVGVSEALVRRAGQVAVQFGLRGYDSVHLAAAETLARDVGNTALFRFVAFDTGLTAAAGVLGFAGA
ncbi:MAG TPA: type II toxin-antitoxin system VapC family toxin [Burkholderiales bacterium]|nr:type II toxin-antitoxin system VapC family toxin [Burkholderiales bacterium]